MTGLAFGFRLTNWTGVIYRSLFGFLLFNTGYGHISAYAYFLIILIEGVRVFKGAELSETKKTRFQWGAELLLIVFSIYFYFPDFGQGTTSEERSGISNLSNLFYLPLFASGEIARSFGAARPNFVLLVGIIVLVAWIRILSKETFRFFKQADSQKDPWLWLCMGSFLFLLASSFGRLPGGLGSAFTSRYVLFVNIGLFSLLILSPSYSIPRLKPWFWALAVFFVIQEYRPRGRDQRMIQSYYETKLQFKECYLGTRNFEACYQTNGGDKIYPNLNPDLKARLKILEEKKWSLFND